MSWSPITWAKSLLVSDIDECQSNPMFCAGGTCISGPNKALCECGIGRGLDTDGEKCMG